MKPIYITVSNIKDPTEGAIYSGDTVADYIGQGYSVFSAMPTDTCVHYILIPPVVPETQTPPGLTPPGEGEL